jgi:hypothetical protein
MLGHYSSFTWLGLPCHQEWYGISHQKPLPVLVSFWVMPNCKAGKSDEKPVVRGQGCNWRLRLDKLDTCD